MSGKTARLYIRCDPEWLEQVQAAAKALSLDITAYVTLAVSERMRRDSREEDTKGDARRPKKR